MLKEEYGVADKKNLFLRGLFGGGGSGLTKEQPENNIIRGAYYALAAALSGAQTTALCSFDEAFTIPTPRAALLSLRTLEILMEEVGLRDTVDPLAGSYFIETLTKEMEGKIKAEMQRVQEIGGMVHAVSTGYIQREVAKQAYDFERSLQSGEVIKVGVNKYTEGEQPDVELHQYDDSSVGYANRQIEGPTANPRQPGSHSFAQKAGKSQSRGCQRHACPGGLLPSLRHGWRDGRCFPGCLRGVE